MQKNYEEKILSQLINNRPNNYKQPFNNFQNYANFHTPSISNTITKPKFELPLIKQALENIPNSIPSLKTLDSLNPLKTVLNTHNNSETITMSNKYLALQLQNILANQINMQINIQHLFLKQSMDSFNLAHNLK